jgi:predicted XRE-type DNA-binding protein
MARARNNIEVEPSSGNVFADIGLANAEQRRMKARLAFAVNEIIHSLRLSNLETAQRLKVDRASVSALLNYQLKGFSIKRLMKFRAALDRDRKILAH